MDNLTLYNYITEAQEALVKYWGEDGKKVKGRFTKPFNLVQRIETLYTFRLRLKPDIISKIPAISNI